MNKAEIRTAAREITDLDTADVSDTILDLYIKDGFDRLVALERRWPFYEQSTTLVTGLVREFAMSDIGSGNFREITSLVNSSDGGVRLQFLDFDVAEGIWLTGSDGDSGPPQWWSVWADTVYLWPTPDVTQTLRVRGYRSPVAWTASDSVECDADDRLHQALVYYVVAAMYQLQEDVELSGFYRQSYDEAVTLARHDIMLPSSARPLIMSGGLRVARGVGPQRDGTSWLR